MVRAATVNMFDAISHGWSRRSVRGRAYLISFLPSVTSQLPGGTDPGGAKNFGNLPHLSSPIPGTLFCDSPQLGRGRRRFGFRGLPSRMGDPTGARFSIFHFAWQRLDFRFEQMPSETGWPGEGGRETSSGYIPRARIRVGARMMRDPWGASVPRSPVALRRAGML